MVLHDNVKVEDGETSPNVTHLVIKCDQLDKGENYVFFSYVKGLCGYGAPSFTSGTYPRGESSFGSIFCLFVFFFVLFFS